MTNEEIEQRAICNHNPILSKMGYLAAHDEAERRMKKGQKQKQCPTCKLWFFRDELQQKTQASERKVAIRGGYESV